MTKKNEKKTVILINRAWIIYFVISVLMLIFGTIFIIVSKWMFILLFVTSVVFFIITIFFEPMKYEFDDKGIKLKGVIWQLGYIKYEHIRGVLVLCEWVADPWVSFEYYELYGPCEEKFKTTHGLRITKTKKTTRILKQYCPEKFSEPKVEKKPIYRKRKLHQKRK